MRTLIIFTLLTLSGTALFAFKTPEVVPMYKVISDTIDPSVPDGKCMINGIVFHHGETINEATIRVGDGDQKVNSNKIGAFRVLIDTATPYLTIYKHNVGTAYVEFLKFKNKYKVVLEVYIPDEEEMIMVEKPVIYAYSEHNIDASIKISSAYDLSFTYPQINYSNNTWEFTTNSEGVNVDGTIYPYLFWEAFSYEGLSHQKKQDQLIGLFIESDQVVKVLEEQLAYLGFNRQEQTDFITYWAPRMSSSNYVFFNLMVDKEYESISTMIITPEPDAIRRVYLLFTTVEHPSDFPDMEIKSPSLPNNKITRDGFTIIEWGGSEIPLESLKNSL